MIKLHCIEYINIVWPLVAGKGYRRTREVSTLYSGEKQVIEYPSPYFSLISPLLPSFFLPSLYVISKSFLSPYGTYYFCTKDELIKSRSLIVRLVREIFQMIMRKIRGTRVMKCHAGLCRHTKLSRHTCLVPVFLGLLATLTLTGAILDSRKYAFPSLEPVWFQCFAATFSPSTAWKQETTDCTFERMENNKRGYGKM